MNLMEQPSSSFVHFFMNHNDTRIHMYKQYKRKWHTRYPWIPVNSNPVVSMSKNILPFIFQIVDQMS